MISGALLCGLKATASLLSFGQWGTVPEASDTIAAHPGSVMYMKKLISLVLLLLLGFSHADVILEDQHAVTHKIYINNLADYGDYAFFLVITDPSGDALVVQVDSFEFPDWYKFSSATLYAVKKSDLGPMKSSINDMLVPYNYEDLQKANASIVNGTPSRIRTLPNDSTVTGIETHYKLKLENSTFTLEKVNETVGPLPDPDNGGIPYSYLLIPIIGLAILAAYLLLKRR